jgi:cytoskeletal protein RodZ
MKKFAVAAVIPLFASFLWAQAEQTQTTRTETTTTKNTWNGTLVDAGCRSTHTEHSSSSTTSPDARTTRTETTHSTSDSTECPVTTTTTTFGIVTSDGKFVRFDEPGNTKIIEMVKSNKAWKREMEGKKPVAVRVVGTANGDTIVLESIK